jgi:AcrR family transcriptional regulator
MNDSKTTDRKDLECEARRRAIIEATGRLLTERDIESTSMEAIAAAVGYTRRTLYAYFASRDEILLRVLVDDLDRRWRIQQGEMAGSGDGLGKIKAWASALFEYSRAHPQTIRLQAYWDYRGIDRTTIGPSALGRFEALNNELADGLREVFDLGIADGSLRDDLEVDLCISQYLYSLRIVIHRALSPTYSFASFEPDEYFEHYIRLFSRAIGRERKENERR